MPCAAATAFPSSTRPVTSARRSRPLADAAVGEAGERADRIGGRVEDDLAPLRPARVLDRVRRASRRACMRRRAARPRRTASARRTGRTSCRPGRPTARGPARAASRPGRSCRGSRARHARRSSPRCRARSEPSRRSRRRRRARSRRSPARCASPSSPTMPKSQGGIAAASLVARGCPTTSPAPESRSPPRLIAATCSSLRSNAHTSTSSSSDRFAANSDPTAPQPTTAILIPSSSPPSP